VKIVADKAEKEIGKHIFVFVYMKPKATNAWHFSRICLASFTCALLLVDLSFLTTFEGPIVQDILDSAIVQSVLKAPPLR
jgi:hypothetical protein